MEAQKKAEAEQLLFSIYQEHSHDATAFHYCLPMNLYSKDKFAAGKLKLYPLGSLNKVKDSKKANLLVEYAGRQYSLSPFSYLKDFSEFLGLPLFFMLAWRKIWLFLFPDFYWAQPEGFEARFPMPGSIPLGQDNCK